MQQEYETKVLEINVKEIEEKLLSIGAVETEKETLMRRRVFDIQSHSDGKGKWFRLRQKGDKTTLTYKDRNGNNIGDTKEIETEISDFDKMAEILNKLKWNVVAYHENKRRVFMFNDIEFCIDSWPKVPTYLEIEAPTVEQVHQGLELLGLTGKDEGDIGVIEIYQKYGMDLHSYKEMKFD